MKKFEYKTIRMPYKKGWAIGQIDTETLIKELNNYCSQGWELVMGYNLTYHELILKREI